MQESMLFNNNRLVTDDSLYFGVDFSDYAVGRTDIVDLATGLTMTRNLVGTGQTDGVVEHPTHGRCYWFDSKAWFTLPVIPKYSNAEFQIDATFATQTKSAGTIFATGSYPGSGLRPGSLLGVAASTNFIRFAQYRAGATWRSCNGGGDNQLVMEDVRVVRRSTGVTVSNLTRGTENAYAAYAMADDTYLCLGGALEGTTLYSQFIGYLKSFKITKL